MSTVDSHPWMNEIKDLIVDIQTLSTSEAVARGC